MKLNLASRTSFFSDIGRRRRCVVCTLSSSDIRAYEVYETYETYSVYTKQALHSSRSMMFPFILRISFINLNQSADYCRVVRINKRKF